MRVKRGLRAYSVNESLLSRLLGSGDETVVVSVARLMIEEVDAIDEAYRGAIDTRMAIGDLVDGTATREDSGDLYALSFELIVRYLGGVLPCGALEDATVDSLRAFDQGLKESGVPLQLMALLEGPGLTPLPPSDIRCGRVAAKRLADIREAWPEQATFLNRWADAAAQPGASVVLFFH